MNISTYDADALRAAFGIDMSTIDMSAGEALGVGAGWGRVVPGGRTDVHQHDEIEAFVIVAGSGEIIVDGKRHPASPGTVAQFDPFETHVIENTGHTNLVFVTFYWRDRARALRAASGGDRGRLAERPLFVFSSPPTPNGDLHLGHLAGPYLGADAFVRFQRMNGAQVWHLTGSDDYQSCVAGAARREGEDASATAKRYSAEIAETLRLLDVEIDQYTVPDADPRFAAGLRAFFSSVVASEAVERRATPALFDGASGGYLFDADVGGGCPTCGEPTTGNICEECGQPNVCVDLVQPRAPGSDAPPVERDLDRYTLALHELRDDVAAHHRLGKVPARMRALGERVLGRPRLDVAISHPARWGVSPAERDIDGQVIWVWIGLAYGFLHGIESLGRRLGRDWRASEPNQDWKIVHFLGFDNSFYHGVLSPALYRLAYPGWKPDVDYNVNEFYLLEGSKFSTSRRHAIWGKELLGPASVDAVRFYLSRTRPETARTNFQRGAYEAVVEDVLIGAWQRWLDDLGGRIALDYDGVAPDAGTWRPEHAAFLERLETRLRTMTASLGQDGFSLNDAVRELERIVTDAVRFGAGERHVAGVDGWRDEARTAIALELAAARLLASCATPVMPRFAGRLAAALGAPAPQQWPQTVEFVAAGTPIALAGERFFAAAPVPVPAQAHGPHPAESEPAAPALPTASSPLLSWLSGVVRSTLLLDEHEPVLDRTLLQLGMSSLQAVTLQYHILETAEVDVSFDELLGDRDVNALSELVAERAGPDVASAVGVEVMAA